MISGWTFGRRLAAGFGVACAVLLLVAGLTYRNTASLIDTEDWVNHTHEVRTRLADLSAALITAESAERGYIITGSETHLESYRTGLATIKGTIDDLRKLTADNPHQQDRLARLQPLLDQRLTNFRDAIDARRVGGAEAAVKLVQQNGSIATTEKIHAIITEADREESELLDQRSAESRRATNVTIGIIVWGGLAGLIAVAAIGSLITASLSRQIGAAISHVESSGAELQAAANQQAQSATEQSTAMNEISTTINELLVSSRQIADSAQRVSGSAEQTASAARGAWSTRPAIRSAASAGRWTRSFRTCWSSARNRRRSARSSTSCRSWPSRPIFSPSTPPSKRRARARTASASRWWPTRSASWPTGWAARPRRSGS
jgi:CHASE3 domain sensor protein